MARIVFALLLIVGFTACKPEVYTPKPRGYFHIQLPKEHKYQQFDIEGFPYTFSYPDFATVKRDTSFFGRRPENPYWIVINYEKTGGKLYLSYKEIDKQQNLQKLIEDSYGMSFTVHNVKADYIEDYSFHFYDKGVHGIFYNVGGDAASAYQFFATDSTKNFVRGALYFDCRPNADSLKPVHEYLAKDLEYMIETLEWR